MRPSVFYILASAALILSGCGEPTSPAGRGKPPVPSKPEPPALWSVESQNDQGKVTKTVLVCADTTVHRSFSRPLPSPNGLPCRLVDPPVVQGDRFSARCKTGRAHLNIQSVRTGDPDQDFVIKLSVGGDVPGNENLSQTLHYRRVGACPSGWAAGDTGAPGDRKLVNSLSGAARELPEPIKPAGS
jgi:hypothetical protein